MKHSCLYCEVAFESPSKNAKFCKQSCASLHQWKDKKRTKIGLCPICQIDFKRKNRGRSTRKFCSRPCFLKWLQSTASSRGRRSAQKRVLRSKHEIRLYELCSNHFRDVEHNIILSEGWDADIIIHDIKTAILWNGPWHYRVMNLRNHSLRQVQTRDRMKIDSLTKAGWKVRIFEDRYYTPETAFQELISGNQLESGNTKPL